MFLKKHINAKDFKLIGYTSLNNTRKLQILSILWTKEVKITFEQIIQCHALVTKRFFYSMQYCNSWALFF